MEGYGEIEREGSNGMRLGLVKLGLTSSLVSLPISDLLYVGCGPGRLVSLARLPLPPHQGGSAGPLEAVFCDGPLRGCAGLVTVVAVGTLRNLRA